MPVLQIYFDAERDICLDYHLNRKSVSNLKPYSDGISFTWGRGVKVIITRAS